MVDKLDVSLLEYIDLQAQKELKRLADLQAQKEADYKMYPRDLVVSANRYKFEILGYTSCGTKIVAKCMSGHTTVRSILSKFNSFFCRKCISRGCRPTDDQIRMLCQMGNITPITEYYSRDKMINVVCNECYHISFRYLSQLHNSCAMCDKFRADSEQNKNSIKDILTNHIMSEEDLENDRMICGSVAISINR